jgi:polar amino acid transport system substrate-binding protein
MRFANRLLAPACALALIAAGCGSSDDSSTTSTASPGGDAKVQAPPAVAGAGALRFCTDPTYPPAEFRSGSELDGFDIDIADALAGAMGTETKFVETGFDGIIAALEGKKCDALIAAMTITPERERTISFVPYANDGFSIMVRAGNPDGIDAFDDLSGHSVAVQVGSVQKDFADEQSQKLEDAGRDPIEVMAFPKDTDAAAALLSGRVDAYFADGAVVALYAQRNAGRFEVAADGLNTAPIGIGVRKDDAATRKAIDEAVRAIYEDGTMADIFGHWDVSSFALPELSR